MAKDNFEFPKRCACLAAFFLALCLGTSAEEIAVFSPEPAPAKTSSQKDEAEVVDLKAVSGPRDMQAIPAASKEAKASHPPQLDAEPDQAPLLLRMQAASPAEAPPSVPHAKTVEDAPAASAPILTFEQLLELPDAQFDIAAALAVLSDEQGLKPSVDPARTLQRIDAIARKVKEQLPDKPEVSDYYDALYDLVLNRRPIEPPAEDKLEDFDLGRAVFQHRGNCLTVGIEALAVARRVGAPIQGAQCPNHFFLRGTGMVKNRERALNFDVTRPTQDNWAKLDDDFYRKWRHFDAKAERSGEYLRPMSDKEVLSAFLASRSGAFAREKKFDEAVHDAERALQLNARNINALINAGYARESKKEYEEAEKLYAQALDVDSQCIRALNNLAFVKVRDRHSPVFNIKRAEHYIDQALKIDPDQAFLYATKGEVCAAKGDYKEATRYVQTAWNLSKNAAYHERFMALREHLRSETRTETK